MASTTTTYIGFLFLTGNSILAINRSWGDATAVIFVIASYLSLVQLFYCLRWFEASPQGSAARDKARIGVWLATTLLTAMFSWWVAAVMPPPVSAVVCSMGNSTVVGGYYALFSCQVATAMVVFLASCLSLMLLFYCLCRLFFETATRARSTRLEMRLSTPIFFWEVAALLPVPVVSAIFLLMVAGGFYALFLL